jgi:hypothetical protein
MVKTISAVLFAFTRLFLGHFSGRTIRWESKLDDGEIFLKPHQQTMANVGRVVHNDLSYATCGSLLRLFSRR